MLLADADRPPPRPHRRPDQPKPIGEPIVTILKVVLVSATLLTMVPTLADFAAVRSTQTQILADAESNGPSPGGQDKST